VVLVVDHGFVSDHATTLASILQAGSAVLVDKHWGTSCQMLLRQPVDPGKVSIPHPYPCGSLVRMGLEEFKSRSRWSITRLETRLPRQLKLRSPFQAPADGRQDAVSPKTPTPESSSFAPSLTADPAETQARRDRLLQARLREAQHHPLLPAQRAVVP
jgi:hypothetical protein